MRVLTISAGVAVALVLGVSAPGLAAKPTDGSGLFYLGNGYPSGPHFNLNIISKKAGFQCGQAMDDDGEVYGNVIYIPEGGDDIRISMESGKGGPKGDPELQELQVVDRCTGFEEGDGAVLRLPANPEGYAVYARVRGTPTTGELSIFPALGAVEKDVGEEDLLRLGVITSDTAFSDMNQTFTRVRGKQKAIDISGLFLWTGDVCDLYDSVTEVWSSCDSYANEWVFNIADFVEYFWDLNNSGVKILKVRFYPLPLQ